MNNVFKTMKTFHEIHKNEIQILKSRLKTYPDFPKPGINFFDYNSLLQDTVASSLIHDLMTDYVWNNVDQLDGILALESRGFPLAAVLAFRLRKPLILVRKPGKLPGPVYSATYELEYGSDKLEVQKGILPEGSRVVIIDDLIATGGTMLAACELCRQAGWEPQLGLGLIQLDALTTKEAPLKMEALLHY